MHSDVGTHVWSDLSDCNATYSLGNVKPNRCLGQLQRAYQILNKERSNKNSSNKNTIDVYDIVAMERLVGKCVQLNEKFVEQNTDRLAVDR